MRHDKLYYSIRVRIKDEVGSAYWDKWILPKPMKLKAAKRWAEKQIKEWNVMIEPDFPSRINRFG